MALENNELRACSRRSRSALAGGRSGSIGASSATFFFSALAEWLLSSCWILSATEMGSTHKGRRRVSSLNMSRMLLVSETSRSVFFPASSSSSRNSGASEPAAPPSASPSRTFDGRQRCPHGTLGRLPARGDFGPGPQASNKRASFPVHRPAGKPIPPSTGVVCRIAANCF